MTSTVAAHAIVFADLQAQYRRLKPEIDARIQAVLDHGQFILGPEVGELEQKLAQLAGCREVVSVSSGTDALLIALMAEKIGPGDAVFLPAFTFTATAEVVLMLGASPVFVDVDPFYFTISPDDLRRKVEAAKSDGHLTPKAIIPVDLFGVPAAYGAIAEIAREHGLFLLADAAQSFSASLDGRMVGALAPVTATSFFPAKPLGCYGDGGALFTDDVERADLYRSIRAHGKGADKYDIVRLGVNGRLDTIQAAILLPKLRVLAEERERREWLADRYTKRLEGRVVTPRVPQGSRSAWAQYSILMDRRDQAAAQLKKRGIPTAIYYPVPMHLQTAYRKFGEGPGSLPVSEDLSGRILSLPMHPYMDEDTADRICSAVEEVTT